MASEGGMHAAVTGHKASIGEGWEEVCRLAGRILGVELSQQASMEWMKHESRSLAEQADAFVKLAGSNGNGLPWMAAAEVALNVTQDQLSRWQSQQAMNPLTQLITAAQTPRGMAPLAETHIEALRRLRALTIAAVGQAWQDLPGYDRQNIDQWLEQVVPVVTTARMTSAVLTDAYLATAMGRSRSGSTSATRSAAAPPSPRCTSGRS
jgi:hypothetical protein